MTARFKADPWVPLPQAPALAEAAGAPVSYAACWRACSDRSLLSVRQGRALLVHTRDLLKWAGERQGAAR